MTAPLRETLTRALRLGLPLSAVLLLDDRISGIARD